MGTVACCKKPNELIDDKDVFRKSTLKKTMIKNIKMVLMMKNIIVKYGYLL